MEDWLGIVLGILFILGPALLEKGNRKKKRGQRRERQLPQEVYGPEPVLRPEMTESQLPEIRPVYVPVPPEEPMTFPEETVSSEPVARESAAPDKDVSVPDRGNRNFKICSFYLKIYLSLQKKESCSGAGFFFIFYKRISKIISCPRFIM